MRNTKLSAGLAALSISLNFVCSAVSAQGLEDLLRGIAVEAVRGALQGASGANQPNSGSSDAPLPTDSMPSAMPQSTANPISADQALRLIREVGFQVSPGDRIFEAPFEGFWMFGNPTRRLVPILISKDGMHVAQIGGVVAERSLNGRFRHFTATESHALFRSILLSLKPNAGVALSQDSMVLPVLMTAPNCPACAQLDVVARPLGNLPVRLIPSSIAASPLPGDVYSRIVCDSNPRQAFERAMDSRARALPSPSPTCDERVAQLAISEAFWFVAQPSGGQRFYPALFSPEGNLRELKFDSPADLRRSLTNAAL